MNTKEIIGHKWQLKKLELLRSKDIIPHTILFSGSSGIGKKIIAQRFLASLFCKSNEPPCLNCPICAQIKSGTFPDIIELYPDEKGKVPIGSPEKRETGSVRWLIDRLSKKSLSGKYGVLIDGADTISIAGQNALLKTIEEPQAGAYIIILTSNKSLILPTILSRCTVILFNNLSDDEVEKVMTNNNISGDLSLLSEISGGSIEIAMLLSKNKILDNISGICKEISSYLSEEKNLYLDLSAIRKSVGEENLITILINIYRKILFTVINDAEYHPMLESIKIPDREKLVKLIKIFLALRKGLSNNLNMRNSLKGMLYSINGFDGFGLPELNHT